MRAQSSVGRGHDGDISVGFVDTDMLEKTGRTDESTQTRKGIDRHTSVREIIKEDDSDDKGRDKKNELSVIICANYKDNVRRHCSLVRPYKRTTIPNPRAVAGAGNSS